MKTIGDCRTCDCTRADFKPLGGKRAERDPGLCRRCAHDHALDAATASTTAASDGWEAMHKTALDLARLAAALVIDVERLRARGVTADDYARDRRGPVSTPRPFGTEANGYHGSDSPPPAPAPKPDTFTMEDFNRGALGDLLAASMAEEINRGAASIIVAGIDAALADPPLNDAERAILTALAQRPDGRSMKAIAAVTGYAPKGGTFQSYVRGLWKRALITGDAQRYAITDAGLAKLGPFTPLSAIPLEPPHRKILVELAHHPNGKSKRQIAALCGYAHKGGTFGKHLADLADLGYLAGDHRLYRITSLGLEKVGPHATPPKTGRAALEAWLDKLGTTERRVLEELASVYPNALTKEQIAERTGYALTGGTFGEAIRMLRIRDLVRGEPAMRIAAELAAP